MITEDGDFIDATSFKQININNNIGVKKSFNDKDISKFLKLILLSFNDSNNQKE